MEQDVLFVILLSASLIAVLIDRHQDRRLLLKLQRRCGSGIAELRTVRLYWRHRDAESAAICRRCGHASRPGGA